MVIRSQAWGCTRVLCDTATRLFLWVDITTQPIFWPTRHALENLLIYTHSSVMIHKIRHSNYFLSWLRDTRACVQTFPDKSRHLLLNRTCQDKSRHLFRSSVSGRLLMTGAPRGLKFTAMPGPPCICQQNWANICPLSLSSWQAHVPANVTPNTVDNRFTIKCDRQ